MRWVEVPTAFPRTLPGPPGLPQGEGPGAWGCGCPQAWQGDRAATFPYPRDALPIGRAPVLSQPGRAMGKGCASQRHEEPVVVLESEPSSWCVWGRFPSVPKTLSRACLPA